MSARLIEGAVRGAAPSPTTRVCRLVGKVSLALVMVVGASAVSGEAAGAAVYATYHVTTDVSARSTPTAAATGVYGIPAGGAFGVQCQVIGEPVGPRGNTLYFYVLYLGRSFYVPDTWTDSPHLAGQPPIAGIPMCGAQPPPPPPPAIPVYATYQVTTDVSARTSPTAAPGSASGIPSGGSFGVRCQVIGQPVGPRGNTLYFYVLYQGRSFYVPDTWTNSPHLAGQPPIAGIPMCATAPPPPQQNGELDWIALGDSYSAGVGVGAVVPGCDQDAMAYASQADRDIFGTSRNVRLNVVACSGHTTSDLSASQLSAVNSSHEVASVTVGGNDIGFASRVLGCLSYCRDSTLALSASPITWDALYARLVSTYVNIRLRMATGGHLYVLTYPIPFSRASTSVCNQFTSLEQNAANALITRLDDTIYQAVVRSNAVLPSVHGRAGNVHFVDWRTGTRVDNGYTVPNGSTGAGTRFATYTSPDGLCNIGRTPFINGYIVSASYYGNSFHPNSVGYRRAAELVSSAIRQYQP